MRETKAMFGTRSSGPFQLTAGPMLFGAMTPSPDGKKLFADGFQARGEPVRFDSHSRQFLPFLSGISAGDLSFSRDGNWVAYVSYPERTLWRSRVNGDDRMQLTYPPVVAGLPHWSPDGTELAFVDMTSGGRWKIFLISAQGERRGGCLLRMTFKWTLNGLPTASIWSLVVGEERERNRISRLWT